ncbi:MAG TPA: hypothetical protein VLF68_04430 [Candidatus Saccharimonadales bacterium]|nr:hypothetical protein [Candidatus Saccharimonadales bacterium]
MTGSRLENAARLGIAGASLFVASRLADVSPAFAKEQTNPPAATRIFEPQPLDQTPAVSESALFDVLQFYPNADLAKHPIKLSYSFETQRGTKVTLHNFTDYTVQQESLKSLYEYLEGPALFGIKAEYPLSDTNRTILSSINHMVQKRTIFLISDDMPVPLWYQKESDATTFSPNKNSTTIIRTRISDSQLTAKFDVEGCQGTLSPILLGGPQPVSDKEAVKAQEIWANSMGLALAMSTAGYRYEVYQNTANNSRINIPSNGVYDARYILVDEETYKSMSERGVVIDN